MVGKPLSIAFTPAVRGPPLEHKDALTEALKGFVDEKAYGIKVLKAAAMIVTPMATRTRALVGLSLPHHTEFVGRVFSLLAKRTRGGGLYFLPDNKVTQYSLYDTSTDTLNVAASRVFHEQEAISHSVNYLLTYDTGKLLLNPLNWTVWGTLDGSPHVLVHLNFCVVVPNHLLRQAEAALATEEANRLK